jgi:hypothetical protein
VIFLFTALHLHFTIGEQKRFKHPYESDITFDENLFVSKIDERSSSEAVTFYLRLVKHLFRKDKFKIDPHSENGFIANIPLKLNKEQYEILVNSDIHGLNIKELDSLVEEVLMQSKEQSHAITQILVDYYRQEIIDSITTYSTPILITIAVLIGAIIISRLYNFSKLTYSAMIIMSILVICITSYVMSYRDCLNDLEVEAMIHLSKEKSLNNPCKDYHGEHESYLMTMKTFFLGSSENKCLEHMRKTFKPSKKMCDPLVVFATWSAKIHMSYLGTVTSNFLELLSNFTSSSNFLSRIIISVASVIFFAFLILSIVKIAIISGFKGIFGSLNTSSSTNQSNETINLLSSKIDTIMSENRDMKRELSIIRECSVERMLPPVLKRHKLSSIKEKARTSSEEDEER